MIFKKLHGLKKYLFDLVKLAETNKLPKILMLSGKKGQGKFTLTNHLMCYIFDKKNYDLKNLTINENNILIKDIRENYYPNIIYYSCSDKNVKIDDIRNLRLNLQKSSINNQNRFIIFDDVEHLNDNCVNALLKTIEEPSDTNSFILINNQYKELLDTLKSRSIEIMVFLNKEEKFDIINKLISEYHIEEKIDPKTSTLTPGNYLKYNKLILEEKIDINEELIFNIDKLLRLNKLKKNIDYLNFAIYLINQYYFINFKNNANISFYNNNRINIIRKLQESNKLNLNQNNLIQEIENYIQ
tara:strand:- start:4171 stop:5067 length:897 start_codon:yes stop_codon:yes gene_type:complete